MIAYAPRPRRRIRLLRLLPSLLVLAFVKVVVGVCMGAADAKAGAS